MYAVIGRLLAGDVSAARVDERALGDWLLGRSAVSGSQAILADAFDAATPRPGRRSVSHHKRQREWDKAVAVWESMIGPPAALFAAVELAKHREHRDTTAGPALEMVDLVLSWGLPLDERARQEIRKRRERLLKKISRSVARLFPVVTPA